MWRPLLRYHTLARVLNAAAALARPAPAADPFTLHSDMKVYLLLVEELRHPQMLHKEGGALATKAFNEIMPGDVRPDERREVSWSLAHDLVTRSPFAKDVVHLLLLLDALLALGNFVRAEAILGAIHPLLDEPQTFALYVNTYVEALAHQEQTTIDDLELFLGRMQRQFRAYPNDRTLAVMLAKSVGDPQTLAKYISRAKVSRNVIKRTLSHVDVLNTDMLAKIFEERSIQEVHVPDELIPLFKEVRETDESVPKYFTDDSISAPLIEKDAASLRSVDSFGLKVIRHTLLGLESTQELDLDAVFADLSADLRQHILHNTREGTKRNYHEIYRLLQTVDERQRFDAALDAFNESRQRQLESKGIDAAREKWKHEFEEMQLRGGLTINKSLNAQLYQWYTELAELVEEEARMCQEILDDPDMSPKKRGSARAKSAAKGDTESESITPTKDSIKQDRERAFYAPYLVLVPPKKLAVIAILELLKLNSTGGIVDGMRTARAVISVGRAVELEYRLQCLVAAERRLLKSRPPHMRRAIPRKSDDTEWDYPVYAKLGSVLTSFLLHVARVPVTGTDPTTGKQVRGIQPAFHHTYQFVHGQRLGIIRLHKNLVRQLASNTMSNCVQPQFLPMLIPPAEWTAHNSGGYCFTPSSLVRIKDLAETVAYVKAASEAGNLTNVYAGLNVLGRTPWTVNSRVLEVISQCWNSGEAFLDIPPVLDDPQVPPPPPPNAEPLEKAEYQRKVRHVLNEAAALRSQRCDTNYKLEIARAFVGEKMFFPHNIDFRGRAYPMPPHLNHLGNDLTRLLFLFWEGRRLGALGLRWLKIHLANVYGMDKAPLDERVQFVEDHREEVLASAADPLANRWWCKGDKPWQTLSVCFELADAWALENPEEHVSYCPVHQDGTCNGLQHYAALGGDIEGARQVNLVPSERPQDVYKFVAGLVEERLTKEAADGNKYAQFLQGRISRKVVKQTVMTNVYGVTYVGAVAQIEKQLVHLFDKEDYAAATAHARYLTLLVFASMRQLFLGAHLIQDWLGESARRISKLVRFDMGTLTGPKPSHLLSVIWTTPLGLPCVQPYRATKRQIVSTNLQDITIADPFGATQVDARKQQAAFPPNYIHLLDATHMLMTAAACGEAGLHFASVHDSYWTHAAHVDTMLATIREQFVRLHEENLIVRLSEEFEKRYHGFLQVLSIPGEHEIALRVKEVRRNIVKELGRALTVADEIYIEKRRRDLLASPDAREVQLGKEMVTTVLVTEGIDLNTIAVSASSSKSVQVLVPLTFPEIPERGLFDVEVVKDSTYFFS